MFNETRCNLRKREKKHFVEFLLSYKILSKNFVELILDCHFCFFKSISFPRNTVFFVWLGFEESKTNRLCHIRALRGTYDLMYTYLYVYKDTCVCNMKMLTTWCS